MSEHDRSADIRAYLEIRTASPSGWSPDGRYLLVSSNLPGTSQIHRLDLDEEPELPVAAGDLVPLTRLDEPIGAGFLPAAPDGGPTDRLLFATDVGGNERWQLFTASAFPDEPYGGPDDLTDLVHDPEHIHHPGGVSRDGRWFAYATNRGDGVAFDTWVRDLRTGAERCVYATGGWSSPSGFSPDGRYLAIHELTERAGDDRMQLLDLELLGEGVANATHRAVTELCPHPEEPASVGAPSWLPDSSAFVLATDVGRSFIGIARGTPAGDWEHAIDLGWDAGASIDWSGRHLLVAWNEDGVTRARLHDPHSLAVVRDVPLPGDGVATGFRFRRDGGRLVFGFTSPRHPGDVWEVDTASGMLRRLTASPSEVSVDRFVEPESVRIPTPDGLELPAFLFRPPDAAGPVPVVVIVHGGPEAQYRPTFAPVTQYLLAQGFAVLAPNIRGSTGYGREYQHLDDVELRFDAIGDLAALHDWLGTRDDLDQDRAALYGASFGGYMVLAGLAFQPERWAAGVDIVGMSDLVTFLENTAAYRRAYREREYGSLERDREVLRELSPINHIDRIVAPLFIIHGANDPRVPLGEAEQLHERLAERDVHAELLVYDDEGHGLAKLENRIDAYPRVVRFLTDVLGEPGLTDGRARRGGRR